MGSLAFSRQSQTSDDSDFSRTLRSYNGSIKNSTFVVSLGRSPNATSFRNLATIPAPFYARALVSLSQTNLTLDCAEVEYPRTMSTMERFDAISDLAIMVS